ncbi:hypothetical protein AB0F43_09895 [Kribbella sp. NPDC023972]|uniref:hypothetical protein n=1 Tax=Kribbella sp. NPDC023972 TaxID=3154795 RepID=UPI0033E2836D
MTFRKDSNSSKGTGGKIKKSEIQQKPKGKSAAAHVSEVAENGGAVTGRTYDKATRRTGGGLSR